MDQVAARTKASPPELIVNVFFFDSERDDRGVAYRVVQAAARLALAYGFTDLDGKQPRPGSVVEI